MDPLVTIQNLIALACGSHSEEESRTSALAACKAIARHGVVLSLSVQAGAEPKSHVPSTDPFSPFTQTKPKPPPPRPKPPKPKVKRPAASPFGQRTSHPKPDGPVRMASRYEAWCKGCGGKCKVNETIWWRKGYGVTCETCGPESLKP